jgi:3-deoxy-7-phosphoheptulonate synthase
MTDWTPDSWQKRLALQQPTYPDPARAAEVVAELSALPPLVTSGEVERLKAQLADAAAGRRFVLQGGACAESFEACQAPTVLNKLKVLLQMSLVLSYGLRRRIIRVGRFAGQYAKPRSADTESRNGVTLPSYRGDLINDVAFTPEARRPDPERMLRGYERAAITLNFIRALVEGGFADLHHPEYWDLDFVGHSPRTAECRKMVESIADSLSFMETLAGHQVGEIGRVDFYSSHEGLQLLYEEAQTKQVPRREGWYNLSTHFPWIGMRTADPGGAHVEYFRGIRNPIAVKVGPSMTREVLRELLAILMPEDEPGRLTLIHRFGRGKVAECLPPLVEEVRGSSRTVLWISDPMHGNTEVTARGIKTRSFDNILGELEEAFDVHADLGSSLGGVHVELSGSNVTECTGGARGLTEADLERAYKSQVDPRLNYEQAIELSLLIARRIAKLNGRKA